MVFLASATSTKKLGGSGVTFSGFGLAQYIPTATAEKNPKIKIGKTIFFIIYLFSLAKNKIPNAYFSQDPEHCKHCTSIIFKGTKLILQPPSTGFLNDLL
jgi:hypothetical protein